jgi:hypothetical protein
LSLKSAFASAAGSASGLGGTTTGGAAAAVGAVCCGSFLEQPAFAEAIANAITQPVTALSKRFIVLVSLCHPGAEPERQPATSEMAAIVIGSSHSRINFVVRVVGSATERRKMARPPTS